VVFSSPVFLFLFLPVVWLFHLIIPEKQRSLYLLAVSLLFYFYGEGIFVLLMLATITVTYITATILTAENNFRKTAAFLGITINMSSLLIFKYTDFIIGTFNDYFGADYSKTGTHLPLGISFFTFQAVSCIVDVYRKRNKKRPTFTEVALYISFFPQLIAGPIVRYNSFIPQLPERKITLTAFLWGARRFVYGLAKKILIANTLAVSVDRIFILEQKDLSTAAAWFGIFLFSLQLYFDFSGYSDMAIGLARMFGIKIPENFNYPYISKSIMEFWRRWHISLSTWFRDYLYIPLGGNKGSVFKTYFNLWIVFFLCGLWHGSSWNYVAFGVTHGFIMMLEKFHSSISSKRFPSIIAIPKTLIILSTSFIIFRTSSYEHFIYYFRAMYSITAGTSQPALFIDFYIVSAAITGFLFIFPANPYFLKKIRGSENIYLQNIFKYGEAALLPILFVLSVAHNSMISADPFIYFRF